MTDACATVSLAFANLKLNKTLIDRIIIKQINPKKRFFAE